MTKRLLRDCAAFFLIMTVTKVAAFAAEPASADEAVVVDAQTAQVIEGALKWLARQQTPTGAWVMTGPNAPAPHQVAMTSYVLMAFMAAGNLPDEGAYGRNVAAGTQFLLDAVQPDGVFRTGIKPDKYMYSHGIATVALAEIYGQTKAPSLRPRLESLIKVILAAQNKEGGWRYLRTPKDADISVSVLQVVALRAAKNAGLDVPETVIDQAVRYVRTCYDQGSGGFSYQASKKDPGFSRTAAAIYSLQVCGQYDDPRVKKGSAYLFKANDQTYRPYGNYYAAPAQYMIGGETWKNWYARMRSNLLTSVKKEGDTCFWEGGGQNMAPLYVTAVNANILAMPYHYVPLYQR